jgi:sensor histidine kinase YesM
LYYSIYTFLIFINQLPNDTTKLSEFLFGSIKIFLNDNHIPTVWLYNSVYLLFVFSFVGIKTKSKKWHNLIFKVSYIVIVISIINIIYFQLTGDKKLFYFNSKIIIPFLFVFGLVCYYPLIRYKLALKKYIITGSVILVIASFLSFYGRKLGLLHINRGVSQSIFLIGILAENIIFSWALAKKKKLILEQKTTTQKKLILQLEENKKLREEKYSNLKQEVAIHTENVQNEKIKTLEAEFDKKIIALKMSSLRSQMNPHFIFNSLNSIKLYIIENEKNNAIYYLNKFSKLIRKILAATNEETITLNEEIETLSLYIDIENIRFSNEIKINITIDENLNINTIKIPSLILQPFIENAIWHGLSSKKGVKKLSVSFLNKDNNYLKINITDNGIGREKAQEINRNKIHKKKSIGLQLTDERLQNFSKIFQGNYSTKIIDHFDDDNNPSGTTIELLIPLI